MYMQQASTWWYSRVTSGYSAPTSSKVRIQRSCANVSTFVFATRVSFFWSFLAMQASKA